MTNRYGEPIRSARETTCPKCGRNAWMIHVRVVDDADVRTCEECGEEVELDLWIYVPPSEETLPGAG
ncbi:hypothetical protein ACWEKU_21055 [Streptomyces californicus]|uniref:hypothetical protein n=1 Tax=Streptomyces californicus TaxID=67351 RepID=UPI0033A068B0